MQYHRKNSLIWHRNLPDKQGLAAGMMLWMLVFLAAGCAGKKITGPVIRFDKELYEYSDVTEGTEVRYTFYFTNPGTEVLFIKSAELSCWCLEIEDYDRVLEPGSQGKVAVVQKTAGFQGAVEKTITLQTNMPGRQPVLMLKGNIIPVPGR